MRKGNSSGSFYRDNIIHQAKGGGLDGLKPVLYGSIQGYSSSASLSVIGS